MNKDQEKLFNKYIEAAEAFYNGKNVKMTDKQYDKLEKSVHEFYPDFNVKTYITFHQQGLTIKHHAHFIPYTKSPDKSLSYGKLVEHGDIISPKYDGCSIVAYYRNGKCYQIISRADDKNGKNQYDKLINKFNEIFTEVDPSITEIFCEAVVNKKYGDRSKANGLINSKYMQCEVDQKLEIKPCECYSPYPEVRRQFCEKYVHQVTSEEMDYIIETGFTFDDTPADGIVSFNPETYNLKMRKIYNNGSAITKIIRHEMTFSEKTLTQAVVCGFNKVFVDGANLSNAKMGPIATIKKLGLGLGAEVEVIRVKKIIPYINKVITKSDDFSDIKCRFCGKIMQSVGQDLICTDPECSGMNKYVFKRIANTILSENPIDLMVNRGYSGSKLLEGLKVYVDENNLAEDLSNKIKSLDAKGVFKIINIPRFDMKKKFKDFDVFDEKVRKCSTLNEKIALFYPKCSSLQKNLIRLTLERVSYILNKLGIES